MNVSRQSTIQNIRDFSSTFEVSGDKTQYTFTKLPEIIGTGHAYDITIVALVKTDKSDEEVISPENTERFITKPLPATNLKIANSGKKREQIVYFIFSRALLQVCSYYYYLFISPPF